MPNRPYNIEIKQGATYRLVVNVLDNNEIKNLTGYSARMQIRDSTNATLLTEVTPYITINNAAAGQLTIVIPSSVTSTYTWKNGVYDLELYTAADADVFSALYGSASCIAQVTR